MAKHAQNRYIVFLTGPSYQGVNKHFLLTFLNETGRIGLTGYSLPTAELEDYNGKNGKNVFDQLVKNNVRTYENIRQIATGQRDDHTTVCLLDYPSEKIIS